MTAGLPNSSGKDNIAKLLHHRFMRNDSTFIDVLQTLFDRFKELSLRVDITSQSFVYDPGLCTFTQMRDRADLFRHLTWNSD